MLSNSHKFTHSKIQSQVYLCSDPQHVPYMVAPHLDNRRICVIYEEGLLNREAREGSRRTNWFSYPSLAQGPGFSLLSCLVRALQGCCSLAASLPLSNSSLSS